MKIPEPTSDVSYQSVAEFAVAKLSHDSTLIGIGQRTAEPHSYDSRKIDRWRCNLKADSASLR
jgi:hypothetical protein